MDIRHSAAKSASERSALKYTEQGATDETHNGRQILDCLPHRRHRNWHLLLLRSLTGPSDNPAPADILAARQAAGLTQSQAAALVHGSLRAWQQWEAGDRRMHPGLWELFRLKSISACGYD